MPDARDRDRFILMAEDDEEDRMLVRQALQEAGLEARRLEEVPDGEALLQALLGEGAGAAGMRPDLVLLDLNMPRKDGREALAEIKRHPELRRIPVIVLTTSSAEEDVLRSYDDGANSYIRKPVTFEGLVQAMRTLGLYWFDTVALPPAG